MQTQLMLMPGLHIIRSERPVAEGHRQTQEDHRRQEDPQPEWQQELTHL
jgi:hypothetical protein